METQVKRHEPLYLKHRPQALSELVGQSSVTKTLSNAINFDRLTHAYLFTGPRGTGKTSTARILAKSLNCTASDKATVTPCQQCTSCLEIKRGTSPAVLEIDAASNNSVDDARILIERAPLVAPGARKKVYIIDECHMLTKEAFNALLKTIEDPPPNVVFVLATTEEHKVIPTIVSRCQRLMFRLATHDDLLAHLRSVATTESIEITDRALDFIVRRSGGGLRDALGLLDQASLLSAPGKPVDVADLLTLLGALHEDVLLQMSEHVLHRRGHELIAAAAKLLQEGREPAIVVQELARHFLNLTKSSYLAELGGDVAGEMIVGSPNYIAGLVAQAPQFERSELSQLVESLDRLEGTCRRTTQPAMHLEVGLLSLCHRQDMLLVRELSDRVTRLEQALAGGARVDHGAAAPRNVAAAPRNVAAGGSPLVSEPAVMQTASLRSTATEEALPTPAAVTIVPAAAEPAPQSGLPPAATASEPAPQSGLPPVATASEPARQSGLPPVATTSEPAPQSGLPPAGTVSERAPQSGLPPAATTSEPAPQPAPPATPQAQAQGDHEASADEVDRVWSRALDELQRRHIPTFSLASVHAVPLSLTERELTLGTKETFVKTLEIKIDHLKAATSAVVGKQINVRIRAITMDVPAAQRQPKPAQREQQPVPSAAPAPARPAQQADADDEECEPAGNSHQSEPAGNSHQSEPHNQSDLPPQQPETVAAGAQRPAAQSVPTERGNDATVIKEAYKLFEGPGSRQIGDKN
ncbi:MAG TPA: DNA polymerase III subunit gamma/tau [Candidatus Obscuribacterales bacterium]